MKTIENLVQNHRYRKYIHEHDRSVVIITKFVEASDYFSVYYTEPSGKRIYCSPVDKEEFYRKFHHLLHNCHSNQNAFDIEYSLKSYDGFYLALTVEFKIYLQKPTPFLHYILESSIDGNKLTLRRKRDLIDSTLIPLNNREVIINYCELPI